jgi:superfamily II DNA or RNA helicase
MDDLTVGSLVSWMSAPGAPLGGVVGLDASRVEVRFDLDDEVRTFARAARPLARITLHGAVRRASTGAIGVVQGQTNADPPRWQVILAGRVLTIPESDLRPHVLQDPVSRIRSGTRGTPRQFWLAVTARKYELDSRNSELVSLGESRVDLKPHQVSVVHRVITQYPHRFLLCDEVGLGKTIEAGLVIKELRARGIADRILVIVPPNLMRQWQFELKTKFNETFSIMNSDTVRYLRSTQGLDGNPFERHANVIVSSSWIAMDEWARLATEVDWDVVIVDEAHHARVRRSGNRTQETRLYKVVRQLVSPEAFSKRSALFLTATPMQLDSGELYSLIELLDPALFPTPGHFDRHRAQVPGLNRLVNDLRIHANDAAATPQDALDRISRWLGLPQADVAAQLASGPEGVDAVCQALSSRHLLSEVLIRNRKQVVGGFMPRHAHRWEVQLTDEELAALRAVEEYVKEGYARAERTKDQAAGFVMVIFQKLMASSIRALRQSLDRRRERLESRSTSASGMLSTKRRLKDAEELSENDGLISELIADLTDADEREALELRHLVDQLDAVPGDSKADTLVEQLAILAEQSEGPKVLLFTEFRETQEYLRERLQELGWQVQLFHGQMKPVAKDASVDAFRSATGPAILLSTEAGGEGRNFQFCHLLVNYDLPWNPMRVEQRIGRVDRIGQAETVQVFNLWVKGTVEERVLDVLERRINIFEQTVGGLDPILGDTERDLSKIFRLGGEDRDRALERFEDDIERRLRDARNAEEKLRDFIMETKSYSREIATALAENAAVVPPADLERFTTRLLADVNTWLDNQHDGTYQLTFHEPFLSDFPAHTKGGLRRRTVAFRPDVSADDEHVEFMGLGHPVVDDLVARVTSPQYPGSAAAIEIDASTDLRATRGWLVVHELGVPALKDLRRLHACFVTDQGEVDAGLGEALLERALSIPNDHALADSDIDAEGLDDAVSSAEQRGFETLGEMEHEARQDSEDRLARERGKLQAYFDYRDQAAADRLESSQQTLASLEAATDAERRRIIPVWRANVARDQRLVEQLRDERIAQIRQLEGKRHGAGDLSLVGVARIEVVGSESAT